MEIVSVVIPTYNRFRYLLNTIKSVKAQTYTNIEIIVVNDCSTEPEYYSYDWSKNGINMIHLDKNSKSIFGYACAGYVRNMGVVQASGDYIAFCDDDDIWFPSKIDLQLKAMKESGQKMSCTDGLFGNGVYDDSKIYKKYNAEHYFNELKNIYKNKGSKRLNDGFPEVWDLDFLTVHNCVVTSSVLIRKDLLEEINYMKRIRNSKEDYDCWLRALEHTNIVYVDEVCFYYDGGHGYGQNY
jgi:teichuronic acid biosynthesis glycosyltransferase TuaG